MIKSRKLMLLLAVFISVFMVLSGCGKKDESAKDEPAKGETPGTSSTVAKIKERGKLVVGVKYDTNLFGLKDPASGKVEGFDIDIAKQIAKKILGDENKIELVEVTSKTRIPMLNNGDIDMIVATMTITEERKKQVDFSDVYFAAGQSLLVKKGSTIKSIADIKEGTKVLGVKGSTSVINIKEKAPKCTVLEFENYSEAFVALKAGQGDTLTTDNSILYGMQKQDANYEVVGGTFTDEPYGIAVKKDEKALADEVNGTLKDLKASGEYDTIYKKWIGEEKK